LYVHIAGITDIEKGRCEMADLSWERVVAVDEFGAEVNISTVRAKLPGGWLIKVSDIGEQHFNVTFIPDPNHEWE